MRWRTLLANIRTLDGAFLRTSAVVLAICVSASAWPADDAAGRAGKDWPAVGGDHGNTRYSGLDQINLGSIKRLGGAWLKELDTATRSPPVLANDMLYINDATTTYALDPRTGNTIWKYTPAHGAPARGGVAVGEGLVFTGMSDAHIVALDQNTGKVVWNGFMGNAAPPPSDPSDPHIKYPGDTPGFDPRVGFIASAPTYVNGMVIDGLTGGDGGARGKIAGLDAKTGKLVWSFYVIPTPGEAGSETWPRDEGALQRGGGAVWTPGAADAELGIVFYGTGNTVPQAGGEVRPGDNLYTTSVVALDTRTGKLRWYYQLTHHDIWEMDVATPIVLYTAQVNGHPLKALAAMRTDGNLFLLDRETGKPVHPIEERRVKQDIRLRTAATQPFPVGADHFGRSCTDPATMPKGFTPGCYFDPIYYDRTDIASPLINVRQAPMSYDPKTGYFYVMGMQTSWWYRRLQNPYALSVGHPPGAEEYGIYGAIDSRTGKIVWQRRSPWGMAGGSGALTTAGGLMFHMEGDGNFQASDARSGEMLWQFQTGFLGTAGVNDNAGGVPVATYEIHGTQYVVAPMGKGLWAFKLGGELPPRQAPPPPPRIFGFSGLVRQLADDGSGEISMGALRSGVGNGEDFFGNGQEHFIDEYAFVPSRAAIRAGSTFKWTNLSVERHTIEASDGSWTSGSVPPGQSVSISIARAGTYEYFCKDHPWTKGQLTVTGAQGGRDQSGTFTAEQADRGKVQFQTNCSAACHMRDLTAAERAPALAGEAFLQHWQGLSADDLFRRIRSTMPQQNPHSLSDQTYVDIVAFLLEANGYPDGAAELTADPKVLKGIPIDQ
jgi:PQQ-dependent dehydrogenase (methanol/ethanol family)